MRAISAVLAILAILTVSGCQTTHPDWGKGPISLSPGVQLILNRYMAMHGAMAFAVTADGKSGFFVYCPGHLAFYCEDGHAEALDGCRRETKGRIACKIFADQHDIVWQGRVTMAPDDSIMLLKHVRNAKYCYDSLSKSYYVVGSRCMLEDEEVTRAAFAGGIHRTLPVYCRTGNLSAYYTAVGKCRLGDDEITKTQYEQSIRYCRAAAGDHYRAHGQCKDGDNKITEAEFTRETAESVR